MINSILPNLEVWILTFNRPEALDRLVTHFGEQGLPVNIFNNYTELKLKPEVREQYVGDNFVFNTLNSKESNSWCARSWNTMFMKAFDKSHVEEAIFIQDDTDITPDFVEWFQRVKQDYDFIWGPAGDQFFYMKKKVFKEVGWFDERYIGCYCGDADFLNRVYHVYDRDRISITDSHNWGFVHNDCGLADRIVTTFESKTIGTYENQHWHFEKIDRKNAPLLGSQRHFEEKWGGPLDNNRPVITKDSPHLREIDWYPWFSFKHGINTHNGF